MNEHIEAVGKMQDFIDEHLNEAIDIVDIAKAASYSPWYARRLFIEYLGISPAAYLRKLRLRKSALSLRDEGKKIAEVALEAGFESPDGFQRAFYREYGYNPNEYEKEAPPIKLYVPYGIKFKYVRRRKRMKTDKIFLQIIEKPQRKAIIKRGIEAREYYSYCREVGCDVWGILTSMKSLDKEPVCLWLPEEYRKGGSEYVQGVEVEMDYQGMIPEGFDVIELPKAKYLMFQGEPFAEEDFEAAIEGLWEAEKQYDPSIIGYEYDLHNPKIQLEPIGKRGYIELLPVVETKGL